MDKTVAKVFVTLMILFTLWSLGSQALDKHIEELNINFERSTGFELSGKFFE